MKVDMDRVADLIIQANSEPSTGNAYVDALYNSVVPIIGHTTPYYRLFYLIAREFHPHLVVELGSWRAIAAAHFAVGGANQVLTINIHREDKVSQAIARDVDAHIPNLRYINGWTWDGAVVAEVGQYPPIDILYIDAWHEYKYANMEWDLYSNLLADEALVICDDVMNSPGATEDMIRFWDELPCQEKLVDGDMHYPIPMGFGKWMR